MKGACSTPYPDARISLLRTLITGLWVCIPGLLRQMRTLQNALNRRYFSCCSFLVKVTVEFEAEGNGQNGIFSHMNRSVVKL